MKVPVPVLFRVVLPLARYGADRRDRNRAAGALFAAAVGMAALPASADPAVLVALGDSLTQGYGLPPGDGLVPQLQDWLTERGAEVTVVNAGVSGDTTAGGAARIGWTLEGGADVLLIALGGNDLLRGLPPEETRANVTAMLEAAEAKDLPVLLAAIPAPGNFGPNYKADFDAIWPELAAEYGAVLVPNMLAGLADIAPEARAGLVQPDGIHPTAEGAAIIAETLGPPLLDLIALARDPA